MKPLYLLTRLCLWLCRIDPVFEVVASWLLALADWRITRRRYPEYTLAQAIVYIWPLTSGTFITDVLDFDYIRIPKENYFG